MLKESEIILNRLDEKHRYFHLEGNCFVFRSLEFLRVLEVLNLSLLQYVSAGLSATPRVLWMAMLALKLAKV